VLCLAVHGCTPASGGAVELSWKLRGAGAGSQSSFIDCDRDGQLHDPTQPIESTGHLVAIQIAWNEDGLEGGSSPCPDGAPGSEGCRDHRGGSTTFPCSDGHGVTGFELPPGQTALSVSPICENGPATPSTYSAPAPVLRTVTAGNIVNLGAVELVLQIDCSNPPCICQ
jgi:hypothetical protein